jgi:hypothetical protein
MNTSEILVLLLSTGIPGGFSYWYLNKMRIVSFGEGDKEEKLTLLIALSLLNVFVIFIVYLYLSNLMSFTLDLMNPNHLLVLLLLSFFIVDILSYFFYPFIFKWLEEKMNKKLYGLGHSVSNNLSVIDSIMREKPPGIKQTFIYLYDFEDNYISSGILGFSSNKYKHISIDDDDIKMEYEIFINIFNLTESIDKAIYIDYESNIKFYHIHSREN